MKSYNQFINEDIKKFLKPKPKEEILKRIENSKINGHFFQDLFDSIFSDKDENFWTPEELKTIVSKLSIVHVLMLLEKTNEYNSKVKDLFTEDNLIEILKSSPIKDQIKVILVIRYKKFNFIDSYTENELKDLFSKRATILKIYLLDRKKYDYLYDYDNCKRIKDLFNDEEIENLKNTLPAKDLINFIDWDNSEKYFTDDQLRKLYEDICDGDVTYQKVCKIMGYSGNNIKERIERLFK